MTESAVRFVFCLMFMLGLASTPPAKAACAGRLSAPLGAAGGAYDPFSPLALRRLESVVVHNTGDLTCDFLIVFQRQSPARFSADLAYHLEDETGGSALTASGLTLVSNLLFAIAAPAVEAQRTKYVSYQIVVPRGQYAVPGVFQDTVTLLLFSRQAGGAYQGEPWDIQSLVLEQRVAEVGSVNIAGGGLLTTVNFGELTEGKERAVVLQTRANFHYQLALRSRYGGVLRLDPPVTTGAANEEIAYALSVGTEPVRLNHPARLHRPRPQNAAEETHALIFRVGRVADKRAGLYRDTIIVEISASP